MSTYNLLVVELKGLDGRNPKKPHLYVDLTSRKPETEFEKLVKGEGPQFVRGKIVKLRNDLIPKYKETTKREVAEKRLEKLKTDLSRKGYGINTDSKKWVVYVLNVDSDVEPVYLNRGKLGKVVYVGQTSVTRERRLAQHQGKELSKSGKYIGSPRLRGKNLTINKGLTPLKILFTDDDAKAFETKVHKKLETLGYRVLGDISDKSQ
jgi:hypothetical protein